jgi:hypothetical protein
MANYPNADNSPGYDYDMPPGGLAYNNARSAGSFTVQLRDATVVEDAEAHAGDIVLITAFGVTAGPGEKAALMVAGAVNTPAGIYVSSVVAGSFVVTHDNHADAEGSTFYYVIFPSF